MDGEKGVDGHRLGRECEGGAIALRDVGWDGSKTMGQVVQMRKGEATEGLKIGKENTMSELAEDGENSKIGKRKTGGEGEKQGVEQGLRLRTPMLDLTHSQVSLGERVLPTTKQSTKV